MIRTSGSVTCWTTPARPRRWRRAGPGKTSTPNRQLNLSLVRLLEIVGEAANGVPAEERVRYPGVPWQDIVDLRNRLIHGYDAVDLDIVWQILQTDLRALIEALERPIESEPEG